MTTLNHNRGHSTWECLSTTHGASGLIDIKKHNTASPATPSETSTNIPSDDDGQEFLNEWDEWSEHEVGKRAKSSLGRCFTMIFNTGKITAPAKAVPTAPTSKDSDGKSKGRPLREFDSCMPCVHQDLEHREKFGPK